jgi:LmbE family N-acetylglucosaminyl deacetylase
MRSPTGNVGRGPRLTSRAIGLAANVALLLSPHGSAAAQPPARTLVAVFAHDDDQVAVAPILARYAREGVQVYLILATDGAQGGMHTSIPRGPELARARADEARCAAQALGIRPPILLGFPDGKLGDYVADPSLLYRLTQRLHEELERLHPDALISFGPDGAVGHPDHRLVGDVVTQLVRAGAPGVPERLFYAWIPADGMRAMNPQRGAPPMLVPQPKYLSVRVPFTPADLDAAHRAMACHRTQLSEAIVERVFPGMAAMWNGTMTLAPALSTAPGTDLFR